MIAYITGSIVKKDPDHIILDHNGMGYLIYMGERSMNYLPMNEKNTRIYTYMNVKEDAIDLYGFHDESDREFFQLLLSVTGVGPKSALAALGMYSASEIGYAIIGEDEKALKKIPGIGQKAAKQMILDLKSKIDTGALVENSLKGEESSLNQVGNESPDFTDAMLAMNSLGYSNADLMRALSRIEDKSDRSTQEWMTLILKNID